MTDQPKSISVITVVLNDASGLEKTFRSVRENVASIPDFIPGSGDEPTRGEVEHLVIDGGSTDGTVEVIASCAQSIAYWISEPDNGVYDAMNKGLKAATGEWVLFLNAGDRFADAQVLARIFSDVRIPDADVIYGDSIADYGDFRLYRKAGSLNELWRGMICSHQSMVFRRSRLVETGYRVKDCIVADHELVMRLYREGHQFAYLPLPVAIVDTRGISNRQQVRSVCERYRMVKEAGAMCGLRRLYYLWLWILAIGVECAYRSIPRNMVMGAVRALNRSDLIPEPVNKSS